LRAYALLDPIPDRTVLTEALRRAREDYRFPANAEVVAWAGEPRVSAVRAAGYGIERVILPGEALARVARLHRGLGAQPSDEVTALVSLDETSGAMAVVRGSAVLYEAPLTWSSRAAPGSANATGSDLLRRYAFLAEVTELFHSAFAAVERAHSLKVSAILTCGSLPDLRSLTMLLAEEFDVDVETLDSAASLELRRLKGHTREEAEAALPALQIAMVASRRWHRTRSPLKKVLRIAVPIGMAAGVGYVIYAGGWTGAIGPKGPTRSIGSSGSTGSRDSIGSPRAPAPSGVDGSVMGGLPGAPPPPPQPSSHDLEAPGPTRSGATRGAASTPSSPSNLSTLPTPVSLSLTSILWSSDRQLVIVEGQVLGVGDRIAGMKIVEIQPDGVLLLDRAGRLRRAELRRPTGSE